MSVPVTTPKTRFESVFFSPKDCVLYVDAASTLESVYGKKEVICVMLDVFILKLFCSTIF